MHENDMFANQGGDPDWEEFLAFMGDKIALKGWQKYRNGLDVTNGTTGEHSVYTTYQSFEIMFHVSTLLPFYAQDEQKLERKRHFGNDIVVLVFKKGDQVYAPNTVKSEFNHVIFVVEKVPGTDPNLTFYRLAVTRKEGVPPFGPELPHPSIFQKNHYFREFLFSKLINAERAALHAPDFKYKVERTRTLLLEGVAEGIA
jgi:RAP1 GTPase activating protein 1